LENGEQLAHSQFVEGFEQDEYRENNQPNENGQDSEFNASDELPEGPKIVAIPASLKIRHPLKSEWSFWFLNNDKAKDWMERLKNVCTFTTVEEFWAFTDNIRPPSVPSLAGCDFNLFRDKIQPLWEVEENKYGGRLMIQVDKNRPELLDLYWNEFQMTCIGEQFGEDSIHVCGAVCNIRPKGHKVSLWTTNARAQEANTNIGNILKQRLREALSRANLREKDKDGPRIVFQNHQNVQNKTDSKDQFDFTI